MQTHLLSLGVDVKVVVWDNVGDGVGVGVGEYESVLVLVEVGVKDGVLVLVFDRVGV